jgi:hypothetical protein
MICWSSLDKYKSLSLDETSVGQSNYKNTNDKFAHSIVKPILQKTRDDDHWLYTGLVVKVISKKIHHSIYLKKGTIIDVYGNDLASLRITQNCELFENVKQKYLETVIPQIKDSCIVLRGQYKGNEATLINILSEEENEKKAIVQLVDELNVVLELSLNDICAFLPDVYYCR